MLSIPAWTWSEEGHFSGLVVLDVDQQRGIAEAGRIDHSDLARTEWPPALRRSVYIEESLYSISDVGVKVNDLYNPSVERAAVRFEQ